MDITILPASPAPTLLTAQARVRSMGEHFVAFLAMNNIHGYLNDPDYVLRTDRVNDILLSVALSDGLSDTEFKTQAFAIKNLTRKQIGVGASMELLARAMGYSHYQLANLCRSPEGYIENVWSGSVRVAAELLSSEESLKQRQFRNYADNPRIRELYTLHNAFNREKSAAKKARSQARKAEREQRREAQQ